MCRRETRFYLNEHRLPGIMSNLFVQLCYCDSLFVVDGPHSPVSGGGPCRD